MQSWTPWGGSLQIAQVGCSWQNVGIWRWSQYPAHHPNCGERRLMCFTGFPLQVRRGNVRKGQDKRTKLEKSYSCTFVPKHCQFSHIAPQLFITGIPKLLQACSLGFQSAVWKADPPPSLWHATNRYWNSFRFRFLWLMTENTRTVKPQPVE